MGASGSTPNPEKDRPSDSRSRSEPRIPNPRILLAEDSKNDLFLIREALKGARVEADLHVVNDGDAAIRFLDDAEADENEPCPALVLLDLNLPKKNGAQVLKHLRQTRRCKNVRVLVVSSSDAPSDRAAIAEMSVVGYFKKPSSFGDFMKLGPLVKELLEGPPACR